ncbi:retrovirus-related Pol polyprotein from transposon 17.6 [Trichonephila clavipes]|nr:retrovirus-related Pol polyprotein from transposon 17.6 [Trichonephila clavipes]
MTVPSIKIAITNSEGYEEEFVKNLFETIIANGNRLEELERAEKIRLEELVKEQALKEKELQLKFDLERGRNFNTCTPGICSGISAAKGYARKFNQCSQKNSEEIKSLYEQAASQVQVTNQVYSLEKELLVKNREDKLCNMVKLIVVPEGLRDPIKSLCHEGTSAHLGITKSKDKLNRYFYWPNCYRDMEQFVKTCDQCKRAGKPNDKKKAPLILVPVIQEVFTKLNIDACGPLPITSKGNRYLITAICMSSKFPEAIPVSDISSVSVTDALLNIFSRMGFPGEIQCDQGTSFTSALTTEFF